MKAKSLSAFSTLLAATCVLFLGGAARAADSNKADDEAAEVIRKIDADAKASPRFETDLAVEFSTVAGSRDNATALITGLHDGTLDKSTGKLGFGETRLAFELAQADLRKKGVTNPTPVQFRNSLNSVLALRTSGQGWGQIAQSMDVKVGTLMRNDRANDAGRGSEKSAGKADNAEGRGTDMPRRPENPSTNRPTPGGTVNPGSNGMGAGNAGGNAGAPRGNGRGR